MNLGVADMVSNFVPGSGNPLGMEAGDWDKLDPAEKLSRVTQIIGRSGFEYLELGVAWLNEGENSIPVGMLQKMVEKNNTKIGSFCSLFPPELKTVGPQVNWERLTDYISTVFKNCAILGGEVIVFGSGQSRSIPKDFSRANAEEDFIKVLSLMAEVIIENDYPLRVAVEPLNVKECNFVNSLAEADRLVKEVNSPTIGILIDTYHGYLEGGNFLNEIPNVIGNLIHIHVAQPEDRGWPGHLTAENDFQFGDFFHLINKYKYTGNMTVECLFRDLENEIQLCNNYLSEMRTKFTGLQ